MQKIKMSFKKVLPFVLVFYLALMTANNIAERLLNLVIRNAAGSAWTGLTLFFKAVISIAVSPFYTGFYKFCFERTDGRKPHILSVFDFYRSAGKILISFVTVRLGAIVSRVFFILMALAFWNTSFEIGDVAGILIHSIITWIILIFFISMPYLYAKNNNIGIGTALKLSFKLGLKYMIIFIAVNAVTVFPEILYTVSAFTVQPDKMAFTGLIALMGAGRGLGRTLMYFIVNVFSVWAEFTAVYCIFERERDNMLKDFFNKFKKDIDTSDESTEDAPFIEPYDFCIEADERFSDEKIIETENIRGVDILAALEEMDLAFDVVNHFGIRRKLKKMFDDLSFEISEFVTYEGGRSIENFFTEEIDEREFEVSVEISKASDYEPFKLILRVDISEEE
ncbi:MAG: hypothetical protein HDT24_08605 [Ruminococcus sp.]|nr:hypothetical protein [Ruminococcus sp.]